MESQELVLCTLFIPFGPNCAGLLPPPQAHQLPISRSLPQGTGLGFPFQLVAQPQAQSQLCSFFLLPSLLSSVLLGRETAPFRQG